MHIHPPVLAFASIVTLLIADWLFPILSFVVFGQWFFGGTLIFLGLSLAFIAVLGFRKSKTTIRPDQLDSASALVTGGLYQYTRNPMYLGLALIIAGTGIGLGTVVTFAVLPIFVWVITTQQIMPEERALKKIFGQEFADYKAQVRRWI